MDNITRSPLEGGDYEKHYEKRLSAVEQACLSTATDMREIKSILIRHDQKFDQIDQRLDQMDKRLGCVEVRVGKLEERADRTDAKIDQLTETVTGLAETVGNLSRTVGAIHGELQSVSSRQERHGKEIAKILRRLEIDDRNPVGSAG